ALAPGQPLSYAFLDTRFDRQYRTEQQLGTLSMLFAALAVAIAALGLAGLAAYTAHRRRKEIGVRKVLGASTAQLAGLLTREFALLVGVAFLIAVPVAAWGMEQWLRGFAYRAELSVWPFVAAGAAALFITLGSVLYQAVRAAHANPARALQAE
ncbi:MAG: FtsX-like permease family protein, partial [Catalinimonas sp.]